MHRRVFVWNILFSLPRSSNVSRFFSSSNVTSVADFEPRKLSNVSSESGILKICGFHVLNVFGNLTLWREGLKIFGDFLPWRLISSFATSNVGNCQSLKFWEFVVLKFEDLMFRIFLKFGDLTWKSNYLKLWTFPSKSSKPEHLQIWYFKRFCWENSRIWRFSSLKVWNRIENWKLKIRSPEIFNTFEKLGIF